MPNFYKVLGLVLVSALLQAGSQTPHTTAPLPPPAPATEPTGPAVKSVPLGVIADWDAGRDGAQTRYVSGPLSLTLDSKPERDGTPTPTLTVEAAGFAPFTVKGVQAFDNAHASFGVGKLDARNPVPQVLFMTYSGGAHCCTEIQVLEARGGRWTATPLGSWDDDGVSRFPTDIDGDGLGDLVLSDNRFLYAFASYADSMAPPLILNYARGKVSDVSDQPKYAALFRSHLALARAECLKASNGACAAFVADAARLGLRDWAWGVMLANYDRASTWGLPEGCATKIVQGRCPDGRELKPKDFPQALEWFLADAGYTAAPAPANGVDTLSPLSMRASSRRTLSMVSAAFPARP